MPLVTPPALGGGSRQAPGGPLFGKYVFAGRRWESIEELEQYLGQTSVTL